MRCLLLATLGALALSAPDADAQLVFNSRFDFGFTGWTVTPTSPIAVGAPGLIDLVDIDGPGPLSPSAAASFAVGKLPGNPGPALDGVVLSQVVDLIAGRDYTIRLNWSSANSAATGANGGRYRLIVPGELVLTEFAGPVPAGGQVSGVLSGDFNASAGGPTEIQLMIEGQFEVPDPPIVTLRVDNFRLESGFNSFPGFLPVSGGGVETMELDAGPSHAGETYLILGSISGTSPGLDLPLDVHLPLIPDSYTNATLAGVGAGPFAGFVGVLDVDGRAATTFELPGTLTPSAVGLTLDHAFVTLTLFGVSFASNADSILLF